MITPVTSVKLAGRRVLLRAGFDVPLEETSGGGWKVADDARIRLTMPTLDYLVKQKAKTVIVSHLGRPEGKPDKQHGMLPVAEKLAEIMGRKLVVIEKGKLPTYKAASHVFFLPGDVTKTDYSKLAKDMADGEILFLENMRFYKGEEDNASVFVGKLAKYGEVFVNDAFSVAHRDSASTTGLAKKLPGYAGITFMKEIDALNKAIRRPQKPVVAVMGGAKIADKIDTINFLAGFSEHILIGGAIANAFLKALGYEVGTSKTAEVPLAKELLRHYKDKIVLPSDVVVAKHMDGQPRASAPDKVRPDEAIFDIGPETIRKFAKYLKPAKTIIWNGPMGLIEKKQFFFGSKAMAQTIATRAQGQAYAVVGGGESVEVVDKSHLAEYMDHVSTGGGAMLEYLAGKSLPAIKALDK